MSFISLKFLVLPSVMYVYSGNMSWLVTLVIMSLDAVYATLIIGLMRKNQNKNIHEFIKATLGVFWAKLFLIILSAQFVIEIALGVKGLEFFVIENFYNNFNWALYILPLIGLVSFMMYKGLRNIARVQEMFFLSILVGCIYIAVKSLADIDPLAYLPFFKDGVMPLFKSGFRHMSWFGSSTFLLVIFGKVDFKNAKKGSALKFILFAILLVQLLYFIFYSLFDITAPTHSFAISDISQFSSSKSIIDELSWLVVSLWVVTQAVQIALYGYALANSLMFIFNTKKTIPSILAVNALIFALGYVGTITVNLEQFFFSPTASIITIVAQYIIPLILLFGYLIKNRKHKKSTKAAKSPTKKVVPNEI